jgi:hypothetical protein
MEKMMHLAAQYLAAAGISFLEKKEDDSHTNLEFSVKDGSLASRSLNDLRAKLVLHYTDFSLEWKTSSSSQKLLLNGKTHAEIVGWIRQISSDAGINKSYAYDFHYELPYSISDEFVFELESKKRLDELLRLRILSQNALKNFLENEGYDTEIRVWPHHFDSGLFLASVDDGNLSIGMGLAIPDTVCDDHYLYVSGYRDHNGIDPSTFAELSQGEWKSDGFKGAVLSASDISEANATSFFSETYKAYKKET